MAKNKIGVDGNFITKIDFVKATKRITQDTKSDFIYAPHINFIYNRAKELLISKLQSELSSGNFKPQLPISIEVPKSSRMKMSTGKRGPSFTRQGSILLPKDRLFYQILADQATKIIDKKTDKNRSFSHTLDPDDGDNMFLPTRVCWNNFQSALKKHSKNNKFQYVVKLDVANCFGNLNQHKLVNTLTAAGYADELKKPLEDFLGHITGTRSSRSIVQGIFPSDLFGNFYLAPIDRYLKDSNIASARYVDDIYLFVENGDAADKAVRGLISALRKYDLSLNESKSRVMAKNSLQTEEPDLEALFADAIEEISEQLNDDFDSDYGFQSEFDDDYDEEDTDEDEDKPEDDVDIELEATKALFNAIDEYPGNEENIERFCLPLFTKSHSDHAIHHVLDNFNKRPSMTQIYVSYLSKFIYNKDVEEFLFTLCEDDSLFDWQRMWILAGLMQGYEYNDDQVKMVWDLYKDANLHESLRAVAAIFVGRFGDQERQTDLVDSYASAGTYYVQSAIYFSSRWFKPKAAAATAKTSWSNLNELNELITYGFDRPLIKPANQKKLG